ncbi:TetR family transcriptional regulator [Streptomyces sp. NPDC041068]|uniref:TetR family transcriptional regulator n=1 Tax=Streptomyces sp. NPDC041068 TaxID=3155130 RepID=UPI0033DA1510
MTSGERVERMAGDGVRARARRAMKTELALLALELFAERGYEETTVEDIARAAGLSKRSFFRYFPAKEDVVFGSVESMADEVADEVLARPADEAPWDCLHRVLGSWQGRIHSSERQLAELTLIESTPSLRARLHGKRDEMRARVADALAARPGTELDAFAADALTSAAAAALDTANRAWLASGGTEDRAALVERAFALLRPAGS